ncbi:MAG TPA: rod shape-determining protein MreD [Vicinamibacteria bacterium]|nr:rod shape-determining protein MreD [Vicinamibacteria bacterium]
MKAFWTALAVLAALLLQSGLSQLLPPAARLFDPFLLVLVYCGLAFGETHAILAGAAAGWVQDVHFGGPVLGLSGLTKLLLGFLVGLAATRFQLTEAGPRALVLVGAALFDALFLWGLASTFDIAVSPPTLSSLALRAFINALLGTMLFALLERRLLRGRRP